MVTFNSPIQNFHLHAFSDVGDVSILLLADLFKNRLVLSKPKGINHKQFVHVKIGAGHLGKISLLSIIIAPSLAIGGVGGGKGASFCLHLHYSVRQWEHNAATTVTVCFHCTLSLAAYRSRAVLVIPSYPLLSSFSVLRQVFLEISTSLLL